MPPTQTSGAKRGPLRGLAGLVRPAWPDRARGIVQGALFRRMLRTHPLSGACLNAGAGEGLYCDLLESFAGFTEIAHVDLHGSTRIAQRPDKRHRLCRASLTHLPFPDAYFNFCLCSEVLEHIPDDRAAARELARVTKPDGLLLASVPHPPAPPDASHVREGYTEEALVSLLENAGFRSLSTGYCFHLAMRLFFRLWRRQKAWIGGGRRNRMPGFLALAFAFVDRWLPVGRPWDLAVLARRAPDANKGFSSE